MTQTESQKLDASRGIEPEIRRRRRFSLIWALPVVAALIAAWLGYTAFAEKGPTITISFKTAAGLEAGKTRVKHHDVELGVVHRIDPSPDLSHVIVSADMNKMAANHLRDNTSFWVVRPRLTGTNLSGLETLVSGAYIEMDPGTGKGNAARSFTGLEEPPVVRSDVPGTEYFLTTNKLGSLGPGSPISFRGIDVGEVTGYSFAGIDAGITVRVFIRKPYDAMIRNGTVFWNASGISVSTGASGIKVEMDSLQAILAGGLAFETPEAERAEEASKAGSTFPLYDDRAAAQEASYTKRSRAIVEFDDSVRGLEPGAPVEFRGIKIGRVVDYKLVVDAADAKTRVPVVIEMDFDRIGLINLPSGEFGSGKLAEQLVARGLRAQLRTGSFITGQLFVALDFFPDAPPAEIEQTDTYPKFPTVPTPLESVTRSVSAILDKVAALPLDEMVGNLSNILKSVRARIDSPEIADSLRSLNEALSAAQHLLVDTQTQAGPLIASLRRASDAADTTLKRVDVTVASMNAGYGRDSQIRGEITDLLQQLQDAARSVKMLTTYLEQHPESVIRGKSGTR